MEPRPPWTLELWISVQPSWSWRDTRYSEPTVVIPRYIGCAKRNLDLDNNHLNDLRELFERRIWHTILYQLFLQFIVTHLLFFLINLCKKYTFILTLYLYFSINNYWINHVITISIQSILEYRHRRSGILFDSSRKPVRRRNERNCKEPFRNRGLGGALKIWRWKKRGGINFVGHETCSCWGKSVGMRMEEKERERHIEPGF